MPHLHNGLVSFSQFIFFTFPLLSLFNFFSLDKLHRTGDKSLSYEFVN
uniref:Uncharacterized protein n=1 Tax=Arundo donax TaxID=35708 RepID=A0A0A9HFZ5_ARUDO